MALTTAKEGYRNTRYDKRTLKNGQYWDTVKLKDGGLILVIKLRGKVYSKG